MQQYKQPNHLSYPLSSIDRWDTPKYSNEYGCWYWGGAWPSEIDDSKYQNVFVMEWLNEKGEYHNFLWPAILVYPYHNLLNTPEGYFPLLPYSEIWYRNGILHREHDPALIHYQSPWYTYINNPEDEIEIEFWEEGTRSFTPPYFPEEFWGMLNEINIQNFRKIGSKYLLLKSALGDNLFTVVNLITP